MQRENSAKHSGVAAVHGQLAALAVFLPMGGGTKPYIVSIAVKASIEVLGNRDRQRSIKRKYIHS